MGINEEDIKMGSLLIKAEDNKLILSSSTDKMETLTNPEEAMKMIKEWIYAGW